MGMRKRRGPREEVKTDVIPVINVSLVVVLTLMIISPQLDQGAVDVNLPTARAVENEDENKVEITCTLDGGIFYTDIPIALEEVQPLVEDLLIDQPDAIAVVRADQDLPYGQVEQVIAEIEKAKPREISLATDPDDDGTSSTAKSAPGEGLAR